MDRYLITIFAVFIGGCAQIEKEEPAPPVSWKHCYRSFEKHVLEVSGSEAKDCGFFTIEASESDKEKVKSCLKDQITSKGSFLVGHQSYGDDSMFCDVAIRDNSGGLWSFFYDSDISGGNGGPATIWVTECEDIKLEPGTIGQDSFFHLVGCKEREDIRSKLLTK